MIADMIVVRHNTQPLPCCRRSKITKKTKYWNTNASKQRGRHFNWTNWTDLMREHVGRLFLLLAKHKPRYPPRTRRGSTTSAGRVWGVLKHRVVPLYPTADSSSPQIYLHADLQLALNPIQRRSFPRNSHLTRHLTQDDEFFILDEGEIAPGRVE